MDIHGIPHDLLELILVHIDSPIYLLRAASTCKRLHRIVAGSGFLDRFQSKHGPPVAYGCYDNSTDQQALGISSRRHGGFDSSYFCLDFLRGIGVESTRSLRLLDRRAGLVLLEHLRSCGSGERYYAELVVCEPLSRRCVTVPHESSYNRYERAFLIGGNNDNDTIDISNFKVLFAVYSCAVGQAQVQMFTIAGGRFCWREIRVSFSRQIRSATTRLRLLGFTEGSVYFFEDGHPKSRKSLLAVDRRTTEIERFKIPHVDGNRMDACVDDNRDMMVFARRGMGSSSSRDWVLEKRIRLPSAETHGGDLPPYTYWVFFANSAAVSPVYRTGTVSIVLLPQRAVWRLDLDRETFEPLKPESVGNSSFQYPCALPWPPVLREY